MDYSSQILFFFSALGAFNGLMMSLYFLFKARPKHISNYFLGALLMALSIRIGKSVFYYFNPNLSLDYLQFGLTACFFIGPSLYFYLNAIINKEAKVEQEWKYHYGALALIALGVGFMYPFRNHVELWRGTIISAIYFEWLLYIIASSMLLKPIVKNFIRSENKFSSFEFWVISVFIGNVIIWLSYNFWYYTSYIAGALSFSFLFYLLGIFLVFNKNKNAILFKEQPKYRDKKIKPEVASQLIEELEKLMKEKGLYRDANLKLSEVAQHLKVLPHRLSQLMNDNLGKTFSTYINEFRIQEAKKMLLSEEGITLEAIGYDCGFNSKSTFYATFKKITGTTPSKYKEIALS